MGNGLSQSISRLATKTGCEWPMIERVGRTADDASDKVREALKGDGLVPTDTAFIVFGSLARREMTAGSDLDWTLLVDGQADPQHKRVAKKIEARLVDLKMKEPGRTGLFGGLAFSHQIIQAIGGEADTNSNTTRRILLLLESCALGDGDGVRDRVVRHLLQRYIGEDRGYHQRSDWQVKVPRFLLNDIVRFWRTMAVDYAAKRRDREGRGWALRNVKLRLSRKLIFASGLATCLSCQLRPSEALSNSTEDEASFNQALSDFLVEFIDRTPLEVMASVCLDFGAEEAGAKIFNAYEAFLGILDDADKRKHLDSLDVDESINDDRFAEARSLGTDFQTGLTELFFHSSDDVREATQRYGVF